jgi:ketosteroid isomerase-like protein
MARSTEQVYQDHMSALLGGDIHALMADYADDAVLMTMQGASVGKTAIQGYFAARCQPCPMPSCQTRATWCTETLFWLLGLACPTWRQSRRG